MQLKHSILYLLENDIVDFNETPDFFNQYKKILNEEKENIPIKWIFLEEGTTDEEKIVAQAISLDIRGRFSEVPGMNKNNIKWCGNQYEIEFSEDNTIKITNILYNASTENDDINSHGVSKDNTVIQATISTKEWMEVLNDWKEFYLNELGFNEFEKAFMSRMFGVLIMVNDKVKLEDNNSKINIDNSIVIEAMKDCADRYGVSIQTIYNQCKYAIKVNRIQDFYDWVNDVFNGINNSITEYIERNWVINEKRNLYLADIKLIFKAYLDLNI